MRAKNSIVVSFVCVCLSFSRFDARDGPVVTLAGGLHCGNGGHKGFAAEGFGGCGELRECFIGKEAVRDSRAFRTSSLGLLAGSRHIFRCCGSNPCTSP